MSKNNGIDYTAGMASRTKTAKEESRKVFRDHLREHFANNRKWYAGAALGLGFACLTTRYFPGKHNKVNAGQISTINYNGADYTFEKIKLDKPGRLIEIVSKETGIPASALHDSKLMHEVERLNEISSETAKLNKGADCYLPYSTSMSQSSFR